MTELPVLVASLDRLSRVGLASVLDQTVPAWSPGRRCRGGWCGVGV